MVGMIGRRDQLDRRREDIDRATRDRRQFEPAPMLVLGSITAAMQLPDNNQFRWRYSVAEIWMKAAPATGYELRPNGLTITEAFSVSELGNFPSPPITFSYGITYANIPVGWQPVRIPDNTPVILSAHRAADGRLVWLIINTQAIDGICAP